MLVRGGHEYILNSAALARWNIDERTAEPAGGRISQYPDGRLNGELVDAARSLVSLPRPPPRTREERIQDRALEYRGSTRPGLTTVRHPGISIDDYRLLQDMRSRGLLTMRVNALLRPAGGPPRSKPRSSQSGIKPDEGDEWLRVGGVKLGVDGGFEGGLMRDLYEKPLDEGGSYRGLQTIDTERYVTIVRDLNQARLAGRLARGGRRGDRSGAQRLREARTPTRRSRAGDGRSSTRSSAGPITCRASRSWASPSRRRTISIWPGPSLVKYWGAARAGLTTPVRQVSRRRAARFVRHRLRRSCPIRRCGRCITSSPATRSPAA